MLDASSGTTTWTSVSGSGVFTSNANALFSSIGTTTYDFIIGSEQIDNITGADDDARMYFDKSKAAFRAGHASGTSWNEAMVGDRSAAFGFNTEASGDRSTAFGNANQASSYAEIAFGSYTTTVTPNSTASWNTNDRLLVLGNGNSSANRSDALVILKDGTTILNGALTINTTSTTASYTLPVGGGAVGQVLSIGNATSGTTTWTNVVTEIIDLVSVTENGNTGYRLANADMANHGDIGNNAIDLSIQDQASIVRGASGDFAFAVGNRTVASGDYSSVFGFDSTPSGKYSSAFGQETRAEAYAQTTLGHNSTLHPSTPNATGITATDRLLVMGNGTTASSRSDALVILKNGYVGIGDSTPTEGTLVVSGTIVSSGNMTANATLTPDHVFESYFNGASEANPAYRFPSFSRGRSFCQRESPFTLCGQCR